MDRRVPAPVSDSPAATAGTDPAEIPELVRLGARLRQARHAGAVELAALADRLHIGRDQLEALEAGDRGRLPETVFVIAQARRVAAALGIDVGEQVDALRRSPQLQAPLPTRPTRPAGPPPRSPAVPPPAPPAARTAAPVAVAAAVRAAERPAPLRPRPALVALVTVLGLVTGAALLLGRRSGPAPFAAKGPALRSAPPAAPSPPATPTASASAPAGPTLVLRAREESWLEVRDSAGATLFRGTLRGERRFPLGQGLQVLAGRPDLVTAAVGSGPGRVLGPISAVEWRRFPASP